VNQVSAHIEREGFCILPRLFSRDEMEELSGGLAQSGLRRTKAGIRHALRHEGIRTLAKDPRLLSLAQAVLGADAFPFRATLFDKSPRANWLVVWHQDTNVPIRERRDVQGWGPWSVKDGVTYGRAPASVLCQILALRVHLNESNRDNGPLCVLPGTHIQGVLGEDDMEHLVKELSPRECLVEQGGVLAMRPLIVHASSKSHSSFPRRVVHIEYAACTTLHAGLELATT